eukprot:jgi/Chrzof1/3465/Cz12g26170.t1
MASDKDTLEKTVQFLQKREGIDKTLKIIRYTSRLIAATSVPGSERQKRFEALQSNVGTSRKAYRLGKFLQDVNGLRKVQTKAPGLAALEVITLTGEGIYYFLDQFTWLMKAGFIPKTHEKQVSKFSAYAEACGYAANILLNLYKVQQLKQQERKIWHEILISQKQPDAAQRCIDPEALKQLRFLQTARLMRVAFIIQDLSDSLLALNDITDSKYKQISHPVVLSVAGLISAFVSTYKYWNA